MITASIVTYNNAHDELHTVINCITNNNVDCIYIVDNSATDILRKFATSLSEKIVYIYGQGNVGYGAGHNIAIKKAIALNANYHLVLNADISFEANIINELTDYMEKHKDVGLIQPKIFYPNGQLQMLCKLLPTPQDILFRQFLPKKLRQKIDRKYTLADSGYDKIMNIPYLSGCFMYFRVDTLRNIGLFDERYFMYFEDTDISRRIYENYKTVFYPFVSIVHAHAAEYHRSIKIFIVAIKNAIRYFNKWGWWCDKKRKYINNQTIEMIFSQFKHDNSL
jgi:GT2 family glycosyltransferase